MAVPEEVGEVELTALCYNANNILFTATNGGHVCVWDCSSQRCFMTWEADQGEIGTVSPGGRPGRDRYCVTWEGDQGEIGTVSPGGRPGRDRYCVSQPC